MTSGLWIFDILHPLLLSSYPPLLLQSFTLQVLRRCSWTKETGTQHNPMPGNVNGAPTANAGASFFVLDVRCMSTIQPPPLHSRTSPPPSGIKQAPGLAPSPTPLSNPSTFLGDRTNTWPGTGTCQAMDSRPPLQMRGLHFSSSTFDAQPLQHLPQSFPPPSAIKRARSLSRGCARERCSPVPRPPSDAEHACNLHFRWLRASQVSDRPWYQYMSQGIIWDYPGQRQGKGWSNGTIIIWDVL
ncbi:hypothetical protein BKA93DRAFT_754620 [Sparassis latifolia]